MGRPTAGRSVININNRVSFEVYETNVAHSSLKYGLLPFILSESGMYRSKSDDLFSQHLINGLGRSTFLTTVPASWADNPRPIKKLIPDAIACR